MYANYMYMHFLMTVHNRQDTAFREFLFLLEMFMISVVEFKFKL